MDTVHTGKKTCLVNKIQHGEANPTNELCISYNVLGVDIKIQTRHRVRQVKGLVHNEPTVVVKRAEKS
jgi:hypothetical protein